MRENPGFNNRYARMFALKMLANYTKTGYEFQQDKPQAWKQESTYFNQKLLVVEIP